MFTKSPPAANAPVVAVRRRPGRPKGSGGRVEYLFHQSEITRTAKGLARAGLKIYGAEIDPRTGRFVILTDKNAAIAATTGKSFLD
jgi:hypothetical protein